MHFKYKEPGFDVVLYEVRLFILAEADEFLRKVVGFEEPSIPL